jgi:hypothetical protein
MGVGLRIVRRWARFRGERCLSTMTDSSAPFKPGSELVVGNRCYVITRILRAGVMPGSAGCQWEIWGRRQPGAGQRGR